MMTRGVIIDLTMKISPRTLVFPGSPQPSFIAWSTFAAHGYDSEVVHMSTHTGTHMDAPSHFARGKPAIDRISARRFVSPAVLVKIAKKAGQTVSRDELSMEEIKKGDAIVIATGWEKEYYGRQYMSKNPGLSRGAAEYLVEKKVNAVAIDGPSIDPGYDDKFTAHNVLLPAGVLVVENLCNLHKIKEKRFTLVAAPLKLAGATGSPVRALAIT
ncbi:MAG: cyclase family protein [Nitrososphaera sp.]|jgi:kynurenine formamidase